MALYWILLAVDGAAALVALYFFFIGLADGSVSSFNAGIWLALLGGGLAFNAAGRRRAACALLSVLAVPALLSGLLILMLIVLRPNWR
jgi:hypothetical protein